MKKQIISLILCIGMILTLVPVFATTTETAPTACNVLFEENFEDKATSLTVYDTELSTADSPVEDANVFYSVPEGADYGQGNYTYLFKNEANNVQRTAFEVEQTGQLYNGTGGYSVEVNFDLNPFVSKTAYRINIVCSSKEAAPWNDVDSKNQSTLSNTVSLLLKDYGEVQTLTVYNRASKNNVVLDAEDLVNKIGKHVIDPDHVYRIKVVMTAAEATNTGATISVYLDDVIMTSFENAASKKDGYICGLQIQHTGLVERGTIDNIKVVEYGTGVTGTTSYINDDNLVSAIRKWEYDLSSLEGAEQAKLSSALVEAKAAFEAENRTQATVDAAVTKLNDWQNQSEESEWSAEVSDAVGRKVTIKANEEITDGKIIVANYSGSYVVNATLPEFTGLAEGNEMEITIPESWTGEVRVFFWDTEHNALMDCEKLTIE